MATMAPTAATAAERRPHVKTRRSVRTNAALVRRRRDAQVSSELCREVTLIGEAGHRRDERARESAGQELGGVPDSSLHEVLMRRKADDAREHAHKMIGRYPGS